MATNPAQSRYLADAVSTATPAQLVVMLYDRLGLDLSRAAQALESDDPATAAASLLHAQQILAELLSSLQVGTWDGAENLLGIYGFLIRELVTIRSRGDLARLSRCADLAKGLRVAWSNAATQLSTGTPESKTGTSTAGAWVA